MLVIPRAAQENARWKFDVQKQSRLLTAYRLRYENYTAKVSDCVCLQFCRDAANPFGYSLIPTFTSGGREMDWWYLPKASGKNVLTSAQEVQKLLDHLDKNYDNRYRYGENHVKVRTQREAGPEVHPCNPGSRRVSLSLLKRRLRGRKRRPVLRKPRKLLSAVLWLALLMERDLEKTIRAQSRSNQLKERKHQSRLEFHRQKVEQRPTLLFL